jgi:hypothetical protein
LSHSLSDGLRTLYPRTGEQTRPRDDRRMLCGRLIVESLRIDADFGPPGVRLTRLRRIDVSGSVGEGQPTVWTLLDFEAADERAEDVAAALAAVLLHEGGWYADFRTDGERHLVFAGRSFRYAEGDAAGRDEAVAYGRSVGVPESQLDWD